MLARAIDQPTAANFVEILVNSNEMYSPVPNRKGGLAVGGELVKFVKILKRGGPFSGQTLTTLHRTKWNGWLNSSKNGIEPTLTIMHGTLGCLFKKNVPQQKSSSEAIEQVL